MASKGSETARCYSYWQCSAVAYRAQFPSDFDVVSLMEVRQALGRPAFTDRFTTLARIAAEIGYDSEAAFSRAFKRQYGEPPKAWRASRR
jgi:AraC-like DNA-binding protein